MSSADGSDVLAHFTDQELVDELARRRPKRRHGNANLSGCQSRLRWKHGIAGKCKIDPGHDGDHTNGSRTWTTAEAERTEALFG
jgi:hypothetical protein